jgi:hypothetical protein
MTLQEAFELLDLPESATDEEIEGRARVLALAFHPDRPQGDLAKFRDLQEAKRVALGRPHSSELVPLSQVAEIVRAATGGVAQREARQELQLETERVVGQLVRAHTSRLRHLQRLAGLIGAVVLGIAGATQVVRRILPFSLSGTSSTGTTAMNAISLTLALCAAVFGLFAWVSRERSRSVEHAIEDVSETLDDKSFLVAVLYEISERVGKPLPWTRWELREAVDAWSEGDDVEVSRGLFDELRVTLGDARSVASLASIVGPDDFTRLIIAKGQERGVLIEQETTDDRGRLVLTYDMTTARPG